MGFLHSPIVWLEMPMSGVFLRTQMIEATRSDDRLAQEPSNGILPPSSRGPAQE